MNLDERKERLAKSIGYITDGNAYIKFNDDEFWPIEYVRLDDKIFSNKEKLADNIINYGRNIRKAIDIVNTYETIDDLGEHIDPFIIKYHPAWIFLREAYGFTSPKEDEIHCQNEPTPKTYDYFYKNNFLAVGFNVPKGDKINQDALMTYQVFESLFDEKQLKEKMLDQDTKHPDFIAFQRVVEQKIQIDAYKKHHDSLLPIEYKSVRYRLGDDGFPLLVVGSNKNKKTFDFRKPENYRGFVITLAKKNPKSEIGRQYKKVLKSLRN